ncbi:MAG: PA14 domain-containing protein, partial [Bacteroidota bacterium]|nr:PA14 domain-containing protein [Bacteroidota bacterium]
GINPVTSYQEPWVSDGTEAGTMRLATMDPAKEEVWFISYKVNEDGFVYFEARRFFEANDPSELWKTSGTPASTSKVSDIGPDDNDRNHFRNFKNDVHFLTWGRTISNLWKSDGTTGGTTKYFEYYTHEGNTYFFEPIPDYLLFYGVNQGYPTDLFRSDGTAAGTGAFYPFNSAAFLVGPREMTKVGDYVFFADHDGLSDRGYSGMPYADEDYFHLMQTDGVTVKSMRTMFGINTAGTDNVTDYNGRVVFTTHSGDEALPSTLWIYEPVEAPNDSATFTLVHAGSDRDVRRVTEGATIVQPEYGPAPLNIRYNPTTPPGSVVFRINDMTVRTETAPPYSLAGDVEGDYATWALGSTPGTYKLTATSYSGSGGSGTPGESLTVTFKIEREGYPAPGECTASGTILREYWDNVSGNSVSSIPVESTPTNTSQLTIFEGPTNADTNYGARIRGYICPPLTGAYTFWIASNDHSELWLSTDDNQSNRQRIAYVSGATNPRQWDKFTSQKSAPVNLIAGKRYYIEALHKQGVGTDNLAVGWQLPDGTMERPIQGNHLSPFGAGKLSTVAVIYPANGDTFDAPADITIQATASDEDGTITKVEFRVSKDGGQVTKIGEDATEPYSYLWENVGPGAYDVYAFSTDNDGNITGSEPVSITVTEGECTASGTITRDYWAGVSGDRVSDVPVNSPPTSSNELTIFEGPANIGDRYATRIRGYICPPVSGNYTFWIASNDHSELWLSTDDDPANKVLIAWVSGATNPRQWNKFASQHSTTQSLVKGQRYYVEALHKESIGTDHIAVGWTLPDGTMERPIPGSRLSPFESGEAMMALREAPESVWSQISVYPNPALTSDKLMISGYDGIDQTIETHVAIINMTGDVVFDETVSCGGGCDSYLMKLDKQLVPGLYLVNMETNGIRLSRRLLIK